MSNKKLFIPFIVILITLISACKLFDVDDNPVVTYSTATITHSGFDFSAGISDTIDWQNNDGDVVNWSPVNPQKRDKLWWRPGSGIAQELPPNNSQKNMGNLSLESIIDIPSTFDADPDPLEIGNSYVVKCFDGYAKFKVLELGDNDHWWAKVKYEYTSGNRFDK